MQPTSSPAGWLVGLVLAAGVLAVSTAAILIRLAYGAAGQQGLGFSLFLAAGRLTIAALVLVPAWPGLMQHPPSRRSLGYAAGAGVALAIHFATWITSLSYTTIVASTTLVTTNPVWVALISWLWWGDRLPWRSLVGVGIALAGSLVIGLGDLGTNTSAPAPLLGDLLALVGSWGVSFYLLLGREAQRHGLGVRSYVTIAYSTAALLLLPLPLLTGTGYIGYPGLVYSYVGLMALIPQLIGHTAFNWAMGWVSPTLITLVILLEPISASGLGLLLFQELPPSLVMLGAGTVLLGVTIAITTLPKPP